MGAIVDRNGFEVLDAEECIALLVAPPVRVGRLVFADHHDRPVILPVNYLWHDGTVVFQSNSGAKLDRAYHTERVAFEVDRIEPMWRDGWSVVVEGRAAAVEDPAETARLDDLPSTSWAPATRRTWVRIIPSRITGRRL